MNQELENIKKNIKELVYKYAHIIVEDEDKNLLSSDYKTNLADFLYVICELEKLYGSSVYEIFEKSDYSVFTINNLAVAIKGMM